MFATGSIETLAKFYRSQGGIVVSGLWSVLVSSSPEQSADFARRYFYIFNDVVHGGWHLAVYASCSFDHSPARWKANSELHQYVEYIRGRLTDAGENVPTLCAVFFDPNVGAFEQKPVIIPLDHLRIGNEDFFRSGFEATHECIMKAFSDLKLDPYSRVPADQATKLLENFSYQLKKRRIKSVLTKSVVALGNATLGALVGAI
jgi:hypothetical protein